MQTVIFLHPATRDTGFIRGANNAARSHMEKLTKCRCETKQSKLRKLYMRVHPDLFSAHPEEKQVNTKSFQQLSEFLTTIKGDSAPETSTKVNPHKPKAPNFKPPHSFLTRMSSFPKP